MQESAAKAARWLGYVPFDAITDARNEEPVIRVQGEFSVSTFVSVEPNITFPDLESIEPRVGLFGFEGRQPYRRALCITRKVKTEFGNFYVHLDLGPDGRPIGVSPLVSGKRSACGSPRKNTSVWHRSGPARCLK